MSNIRAVIVEDERPTARLLNGMIASLRPDWSVTILPGTLSGAVKWFVENPQPDLIFLDIHLMDGTAFELLEQAAPTGLIVFTTAYDEYAVKAFSVNGIDYLLKPVMQERLVEAIAKFERLSPQQIDKHNKTILEALHTHYPPLRQATDRASSSRRGRRCLWCMSRTSRFSIRRIRRPTPRHSTTCATSSICVWKI